MSRTMSFVMSAMWLVAVGCFGTAMAMAFGTAAGLFVVGAFCLITFLVYVGAN